MPATLDAHSITLDTLGELLERGYGMFGTCLYRMDAPAEQRISSYSTLTWQDWGRSAVRRARVFEWRPLPSLRPSRHRISDYHAALSSMKLALRRALAAPR